MSFLVADKVHCNIYQAQWNFNKYSFHPGTFRVERVALKNRQNLICFHNRIDRFKVKISILKQ